ncbi:MAG: biotin--[acetyl-CoA-carboxylase] ligase [Betaproteobacteria bacterium]|nr:MAG: biotin--[acetyl-CoA-carboxylase] ligase [Betaproteobacteria bacterium]
MTVPVFPFLRFLSDGRSHAFDEIRQQLGLSQACVSEVLDSLASAGLEIEINEQTGCRLLTPFCALNVAQVERFLGDKAHLFSIEVVDQTGSTNEDLMLRARQGAAGGLVRVAEEQSAGRGRRRRRWVSALGGTLTFSLLWNFDEAASALSSLSLAVGVSLVRSLQTMGLQGVQLKWPNDLLWQQRKLGGILIESIARPAGGISAVIGIGINLRLLKPVTDLIDQPTADLGSAGVHVDRNRLLARVLSDLSDVLGTYSRNGFGALRAEWQRAHAYQDKMVAIEMSGEIQLDGRALGVDETGALLVQTAEGTRTVHSGELSLRLKAG